MTSRFLSSTSKKASIALATTAVTGATGTAVYVYSNDGLSRQAYFWSRVFPIVADYWIQTSSKSPLVKYRHYKNHTLTTSSDHSKEGIVETNQRTTIQRLHEKHAPSILQVMLNLKGLYIKLGQVLSVTALPVPEPYRVLFRTLQSDVPGHEEYESIVKPTLERELVANSSRYQTLEDIFEYIDPIPCGAASIGQAHRATLKQYGTKDNQQKSANVVIKVQYPNAAWQVPADIQCVGDFLKICIWAGVVDPESSKMSFEEFSRQFLSELDYEREMHNLKAVYESSLEPSAPYIKHNVVIPKVYQDFCTKKIITMSFLPGVTMEMEAKRQLEMLGIDTSGGLSKIIKDAANDAAQHPDDVSSGELVRRVTKIGRLVDRDDEKTTKWSWNVRTFLSSTVTRLIDIDSILWAVRAGKKVLLWYQAAFVTTIQTMPKNLVPLNWQEWSEKHQYAAEQARTLGEIDSWCRALFDVHGHQIFNLGLFNADPHPGNILIDVKQKQIGLIDYGQVKRLTAEEQVKVARLILSVANNEPDENIARAFRDMNIITKNDSTEFLATFGKLMFGKFKPEYLQHSFHKKLHATDRILYFPKELSMVYRTSLLLRGLGVSLQLNYSVGDEWKDHAQECVDRYESLRNVSNKSEDK